MLAFRIDTYSAPLWSAPIGEDALKVHPFIIRRRVFHRLFRFFHFVVSQFAFIGVSGGEHCSAG